MAERVRERERERKMESGGTFRWNGSVQWEGSYAVLATLSSPGYHTKERPSF
jgi:hypothetical protein